MDNVDETLHATLEANLENGVNKRLKPEESEADCRIGNNLEGNNMEGNNLEGNHHESQEDHFHQEEMSEGSEVVFNIIISLLLIVINMMMMMMMMMVVVRWAREKEVL